MLAALSIELIADHCLRWQSMRMLLTAFRTIAFAAALTMLVACASVPPAQSLLTETDDLVTVTNSALQLADRYGQGQVLVVFDIDNTLLAMEQGLGSDQWYYWQKDLEKRIPAASTWSATGSVCRELYILPPRCAQHSRMPRNRSDAYRMPG